MNFLANPVPLNLVYFFYLMTPVIIYTLLFLLPFATNQKKKKKRALVGVAQGIQHSPVDLKVTGSVLVSTQAGAPAGGP